MNQTIVNLLYLLSSVLFIYGLKGLSHPRTAVRGNLIGAVGMLIAIVATLMLGNVRWEIVISGMIIGSGIGTVWSFKVPMTAMPELVAMFNGFGGIASVLVAGAAFITTETENVDLQMTISTAASGLIGGVTFTGSVVAFFKLQNVKWIPDGGFFRGQQVLSTVLLILCVLLGAVLVYSPASVWAYWVIVPLSFVLGVTLVSPIGGADMPVVIALLNSYSGLAACATGFVLNNSVLIVAGSLVGASGVILTNIMCKAMNRSVWHVVFGTLGPSSSTPSADDVYAGKVKATSPEEVAMLFDGARRVVIAPGYGMAAAQCQHVVRDLANLLEARGIEVEYAIHPVAGRMPGHMNVLLAEADIPYDKLKEMDEINPTFSQTDVAIVIGANDVVNPVARTDPNSPIAGMPILDVDKARTVVVIKRSLSPGFAGIPNPLFAADNTLMLFGDGKKAVLETIAAIKAG
ncbi:MAG TPA: NAD(P)(+) transhydrogenase (Re/Si-specific) subunit beta [bacterium]|nr:NAD(P)(+) transhydrogenase (Re/Si-specific) subunit beta [bacterium]HQL61934.1 NAD(P)(+) transhydrogenase (Re/Si-specific) subunit beta [bacterium]